jgi:hypothetical protein
MNGIFIRNKLLRIILLSMTFSLLFVTTFGCTYFSPIVGKWQDNEWQGTIEFTSDGYVILESDGHFITGEYELIGDNIVKLDFEGIGGDLLSALGSDTWQYTISGDTMTIEGGGSTSILYRLGSTGSNTSDADTQTTTISPSQHKYNVGDNITRITWDEGYYLIIVDIELKDGILYYIVGSSYNEFDTSYEKVSYIDNNPDFHLMN